MNIQLEAERIASLGNGFGVPCSELLKVEEKYRPMVWAEIVKIGIRKDNDRDNCSCEGY